MNFKVEKLARRHPVDDFDCGQEATQPFPGTFRTYQSTGRCLTDLFGLADNTGIGFYTLVVSEAGQSGEEVLDKLLKC